MKVNEMIDLTGLVYQFLKEYEWHLKSQNPKPISIGDGINSGLCDIFAERVKAVFPQSIMIYDEDIDHTYVIIEGKYYDAENPLGVTDRKLMVFGGRELNIVGDE